ncbi:CHAT domain-containing protein [Streptomyces collinus]|uniref:CHAT domain-containing protein n=1 Tax=Streptomyces collinus TaxID=42684 RepID=UPI001F175ED7|nr:CHAT domain-containing protein [Streptomyces collinus]UJA11692.1 CHAT domain protein [Streptomyces collinus]UJA13442.1 CHAT domain protein [Streptomyces collinus]
MSADAWANADPDELAQHVVRLLEVAEPLLAGDPERGGTPDGRERGRAALEEAERALALPRPRVPEPDRQRWWAELSLWAAEIRYACGRGPGDLDTLISRLDAVHALATAARTGAEPEPERRELVDLTCELALNLAARWGSGERRELRSADADRVVALLRAVLDGPDRHLVADPTRCRTALGLVLSGRSRGPDHHTPERLADRAAALGLLHTAYTAADLDPELAPAVTFDLVLLSLIELNDRVCSDSPPAERGAAAERALVLLDRLSPLLADPGPDGADAAGLGADVCDLLVELSVSPHDQGRAADWYRRALAHPALPPGEVRDLSSRLAHVLCLRSEENRAAQRAGDPLPAADRAEAVVLLEQVLAGHPGTPPARGAGTPGGAPAEAEEDFVAHLTALVQALWLNQSEGLLDDRGVDRLAAAVRQLIPLIGPDDTDRSELILKAAIVLNQRAVARGMPLTYDLANSVLRTGRPDPSRSLECTAAPVVADLREAIALLRKATGLYHHEDTLHLYAQGLLGIALSLDFACRLPTVEPAVLRDALRYLRVALERLPQRDGLDDADLRGSFLLTLMYQVWFTDPFARAGADPRNPSMPDVSGFPTVEDDLHLLGSMLSSGDDARREPILAFLSVMVNILRTPDVLPSVEDCRAYADRLRRAAGQIEPEAHGLRAATLAIAGALGLRVVQAGQAGPAERAATTAALRAALGLVPPGSPLSGPLRAALRETSGADVWDVLRTLLGRSATRGGPSPARPGTPGGLPPAGPDALGGPPPGRGPRPAAGPARPAVPPGPPSPRPPAVQTPTAQPPTGSRVPRPPAPNAPAPQAAAPFPEPRPALPVPDLAAAVLLGDGSPDPFALPSERVAELLGPEEPTSAPTAAALALLHHHRWLRERDGQDLDTAVVMARRALDLLDAEGTGYAEVIGPAERAKETRQPGRAAGAGSVGPVGPAAQAGDTQQAGPPEHPERTAASALAGRCTEFLARLLLDRHLILGDHTDLDAAVLAYDTLLERTAEHLVLPPLGDLLAASGEPRVPARIFRSAPGGRGAPFRAELLATAATDRMVRARARRTGDGPSAADAPGALAAALRALPPDHPGAPAARHELAWRALESARAGGDADATRSAVRSLVDIAAACPPGPHRPGLLLRSAAALCASLPTAGRTAPDPDTSALLDRAVALFEEAAEYGTHDYHGSRSRCLYGLGTLLLVRRLRGGGADDLRRSVAVLGEALALLNAAPGDPFAVALLRVLAEAHRAHGPGEPEHRRRALATARSLLTAHGRAVLLQSGAAHGLEAARAVAADMLRVVRWSLADGLPESAFEALELGRGLVLNAATVGATVPELLRAGGHQDLARSWEEAAAGGDPRSVPDGLRGRVLQAFAGSDAERRLLSAPRPGRVGQALRRLGDDALVYLVPGEAPDPDGGPGEGPGPGHLLIVTATGVVHALPLPGLTDAATGPLGAYARALDAFQAAGRAEGRPAPEHPQVLHTMYERKLLRLEREWQQALETLCSWAGEVVMGPLLAAGERWWPGRPARLVLAPLGALGIVPWHAARCPAPSPATPSGTAVYACQRAAVSSCATARQLIEVAARPRAVPAAGKVAVVADPGGTPAMHREAALVGSLYPGSVVIGGLGDRAPAGGPEPLPAEPASLAPFLPGRGPVPTAVLHVNCHADTGRTPADSVLELDAAHRVSVTDLLAGAAGRDPSVPGGTVVLANCTSDLALSDHDEALTLATAFLGAGATAVVGSRWDVADDPRTTLLMLVFHHRLSRGEPAGEALRAAQRWMLDPERVLPPELARHEPLLRAAAGRPLDELEVWAAFAHHGR